MCVSIKKIGKLLIISAVFSILVTGNSFAAEPGAVDKYNKGIDLIQDGKYEEAIGLFRQAIGIDPTFTDAYYNLGTIYEYLKQNENAIMSFEVLLKHNPKDKEAAYKIATLYYNNERYKKALSYIPLVPADSPKYKDTQSLYRKIVSKVGNESAKSVIKSREINAEPVKEVADVKATPEVVEPKRFIIKNFQGPTGIAKDSSGNLYVANFGDNTVLKITPAGQRTIVAKSEALNGPIGLAIDYIDNIYIANYNANQVLKLSKDGKLSVLIDNVKNPYYLYIDNRNELFVSEQGSNSVVRYKL